MYGQLFGSLNIAVAYRHILENPYRSEFIRVLAETLKILAHLGDPLPNLIATQYPDVARLIEHPSAPVVLELCGITQNRLLRENGASNIEVELMLLDDMQENPGMFVPLSFRIADVTPDDIVAVHDLSAWSIGDDLNAMWSPEASKVAEVRQPPTRWLADAKID
jgi:hypothetical protein